MLKTQIQTTKTLPTGILAGQRARRTEASHPSSPEIPISPVHSLGSYQS